MRRVAALWAILALIWSSTSFGQADKCGPAPQDPNEPYYPYKKPSGYWDQGNVGACGHTNYVNTNIDLLGKDCDKDGKLFEAIQNCLFQSGDTESWATGLFIGDPAYQACKAAAVLAQCGVEITFDPPAPNPGWGGGSGGSGGTPGGFTTDPDGNGPLKSPCDKIKDALASTQPKKVVVASIIIPITKPDGTPGLSAHAIQVRSIDCVGKKMNYQDPNNPDIPRSCNFNSTGKISNSSEPYWNDFTIRFSVTEEKH